MQKTISVVRDDATKSGAHSPCQVQQMVIHTFLPTGSGVLQSRVFQTFSLHAALASPWFCGWPAVVDPATNMMMVLEHSALSYLM